MSKVMDNVLNKTKEMMKSTYSSCNSSGAWDEKKRKQFKRCTEDISSSLGLEINELTLEKLEKFAANNLMPTVPVEVQIGQHMTDVILTPFGYNELGSTLTFIRRKSESLPTPNSPCSELTGCGSLTRKILLQLKTIEWKILGLGDGTAGMFLANHYPNIGPYFGDKNGHDWPHSPLNQKPKHLELKLHEMMMKITEKLSNGTLQNVSIIDLPAFGSYIPHFEKGYKALSNWPTEVNFEIYKKNRRVDALTLFTEYKNLLEDWQKYMIKIYKKEPQENFTSLMENNKAFDFTNHIRTDMTMFLKVMHGSFRSPSEDVLDLWKTIAISIFEDKELDSGISSNGPYDKLLTRCGFRKNVLTHRMIGNRQESCNLFLPTLTSNGFCHTFNGQTPSEIWQNATMFDSFKNIFPTKHPNEIFHGAGTYDGKKCHLII